MPAYCTSARSIREMVHAHCEDGATCTDVASVGRVAYERGIDRRTLHTCLMQSWNESETAYTKIELAMASFDYCAEEARNWDANDVRLANAHLDGLKLNG